MLNLENITNTYIKTKYSDINLVSNSKIDIEHISFKINNKLVIVYNNGIITTNYTFETIKSIFEQISYTL